MPKKGMGTNFGNNRGLIVGFTGKIGAGKTTAATELLARGFVRVRFAGILKDMMKVLGLTDDQVDGAHKETPCPLLCGRTPRHAMQTIGTEWGRNLIGNDLWVNAWRKRVTCLPPRTHVVADDVRFANEADTIRSMGGVVVRIVRMAEKNAKWHEHVSEQGDFRVDLTVMNNGTEEMLRDYIRTNVLPQLKQAA
jgi:hypothetical protein